MGKWEKAATVQRCYLYCEEGVVSACVRTLGVSMLCTLVCVGWRVRGRVCREGSGAVCLKVPKET